MRISNLIIFFLTLLFHILILFISSSTDTKEGEILLRENTSRVSIKIEPYKYQYSKSGKVKAQKKSDTLENNEVSLKVTKEEAKIVSQQSPTYPYLSIVNEEEGEVVVEIDLDEDGIVSNTRILNSSKFKRLDEEAIRFIKSVKFSPAKNSQGISISSTLTRSISFKLNN